MGNRRTVRNAFYNAQHTDRCKTEEVTAILTTPTGIKHTYVNEERKRNFFGLTLTPSPVIENAKTIRKYAKELRRRRKRVSVR